MSTTHNQRAVRPLSPVKNSRAVELESVIRKRISSRLGRRIRNFAIAVDRGVIYLAGQCSTYYSKQLAQHVVLGVVEDEIIENEIEVTLSPSDGKS